MKFIKLLIKSLIKLINWIYNFYVLRKANAKVSSGTIKNISGRIFLVCKGDLEINETVRINSVYSANPIGGQEFTTIIIREDAKLTIKEGTGISNSTIICWDNIYIGRNVYIGGDCKIFDTDFHSINLNYRISEFDYDIKTLPITINDGAFIGANTIILKGVNIGENSVIGAGSVVTKSVPDNEIWGGNPARFIKKI